MHTFENINFKIHKQKKALLRLSEVRADLMIIFKPSFTESFHFWTNLNFEIPTAQVFQLEVYHKVERLQTGLTAQQIGTSAQCY